MATRKKVKKTTAKKTPARGKAVKAKKKTASSGRATSSRDETLRKILVQRREDLLKETQEEISKYIKGENRQLVETALDDGDWSVVDLSEDINLRKLSINKDTLLKIEESLRKIKEKTYGVCEDCGENINPERLKILPFAIRCRDCQEEQEERETAEREEEHSRSRRL